MRKRLFVAAIAMLTAAAARAEEADEGPSLTLSSDMQTVDSSSLPNPASLAPAVVAPVVSEPVPPAPEPPPELGGPIGGSWTPEGSGIKNLDAEYAKNRSAISAVYSHCAQEAAAAAAGARPRAFTGQPTAAQKSAAYAALSAAGVDFVGAGYVDQVLACGGTPADAVSVFGDACRHFQYPGQTLSSGCYFAFAKSHDGGQTWANAFCAGMPVFYDCMQPKAGMQPSYDPAEVLRRASFGANWAGDFTAQPTYEGHPELDGHRMLADRLAYFDGIKDDLQPQGYDPQLIYTLIMTHELLEKCEAGDYFCTSFNNSPKLSSYQGKTLAQYLQTQKILNR